MSDEARVVSSLSISVGNLSYARQTAFTADVSTAKGATPGQVLATVTGTNVSLAAITTPGLFRIANLDDTNFVLVGTYDGTSFFPFLELLPGEVYVGRLWRAYGDEFAGTSSAGADTNQLQIRADTASCNVEVEVFEK